MGRPRGRAGDKCAKPDLPAHRAGGHGLSGRRGPERLAGLVDSHCHLQHPQFDADREAVLDRAWAAGIERIMVPGWDVASSEAALALAERHAPLVQAAVGVHPHDARTIDEEGWRDIEGLAADSRCAAVGEIGLDFFRNLSPPDTQRAAFARQLALAAHLGRPVLVHDRDAHDEVRDLLLAWDGRPEDAPRGVLHAFSGDVAMAAALTARGFLLSFALPVTFRSAAGPRAAAVAIGPGDLLVETDAPYLGPERGARNEPTTVLRVVAELARLRSASVDDIALGARRAYDRLLDG